MKVAFSALKRRFDLHQQEYEEAACIVLNSGWYVLGNELKNFEESFAAYIGMRYGIGVNSGQDALILAVRALGIGAGDEVITQANAYIASVLGITENGATPVFVEPDEYFGMDADSLEKAITPRTKAILPVHLYGHACDLKRIREIADRHGIPVIEDCAQCHGSSQNGIMAGAYGTISCFSFYPTKPLGAFGDAGACLTNDPALDEKLRMLRFYGSKKKYVSEILGVNSRMDEMQAALLCVGLKYVDEEKRMRQAIAERYLKEIRNPLITLPKTRSDVEHVYHIFAILCEDRDGFAAYLEKQGVQVGMHYPIPPHLAPCYQYLGYHRGDFPRAEYYSDHEVSLPIYAGMPKEEVDAVIDAVNSYRGD